MKGNKNVWQCVAVRRQQEWRNKYKIIDYGNVLHIVSISLHSFSVTKISRRKHWHDEFVLRIKCASLLNQTTSQLNWVFIFGAEEKSTTNSICVLCEPVSPRWWTKLKPTMSSQSKWRDTENDKITKIRNFLYPNCAHFVDVARMLPPTASVLERQTERIPDTFSLIFMSARRNWDWEKARARTHTHNSGEKWRHIHRNTHTQRTPKFYFRLAEAEIQLKRIIFVHCGSVRLDTRKLYRFETVGNVMCAGVVDASMTLFIYLCFSVRRGIFRSSAHNIDK